MSRLIDADELGKVKFHPLPYTHIVPNGENVQSYERGWNDAIDAVIEDAPTIDAVEVVRCKDCVYYRESYKYGSGDCIYCNRHTFVVEDDYCSCGERREVQRNFNASNVLDALEKE